MTDKTAPTRCPSCGSDYTQHLPGGDEPHPLNGMDACAECGHAWEAPVEPDTSK